MQKQYFETTRDWEKWLETNHDTETELWLIYYKKHTGKEGVSYEDSVKAALCWGWIDGLVKKIDEACYARRFTPRKENSVWSESNKKRVAELLEAGKMKPAGLKLVDAAKQNGNWGRVITPPQIDLSVPDDFKDALSKQPPAKAYFDSLSKRHQKEYLMWIIMAKREETRKRRIDQSIELLLGKRKLGLK